MKRVFIGVGHGGSDPGAVYSGIMEKDANLTAALKMKEVLDRYGVETGISRPDDRTSNLNDKIAAANQFKPDYTVEIHFNAGGGKGFLAFHQTNKFKAESAALAARIENEVLKIGQNSTGCRTRLNDSALDYYGWLRNVSAPSVLVEGAFMDNPADMLMMDTREKQQAFGAAYAYGVLNHLGINTEAPMTGEQAIAVWAGRGVINSPQYWLEQLGSVKYLEDLFVKTAKWESK